MRKCWWILFVIFFFAQGAFADPVLLPLDKSKNGKKSDLKRNMAAVIELEVNPSTGYTWQDTLPKNAPVKILGRQFKSDNPGMLGAPGVEKIYVVGAKQGSATLEFNFKRAKSNNQTSEKVRFDFKSEGPFNEKSPLPKNTVRNVSDNKRSATSESDSDTTPSIGLPQSFNWCDEYGCTPIKDQGNCGSCWAFATAGVFENEIKIKDNKTVDLSEQYLISCNDEGYSCNGGWWAHDYHQDQFVKGESEAGAVSEATKKYAAANISCAPQPNAKIAKIESWSSISSNPNAVPSTAAIKQAIYDHGPIAAAVCVDFAFNNYSGGIFKGSSQSCGAVNHGIVLVGWNDDGQYWILRNSWGTWWGEAGYMNIGYGVNSVGAGASWINYAGGSSDTDDGGDNDDSDDTQTVAVTGVTVTPTSASVDVDTTTTLTATVSPDDATDKSVTWSSSNSNIATVDADGMVTGVTAGSATITAKTVDGGFTATSSVSVNSNEDYTPGCGW
jgi:uncharacterized protein YjdB/predicted secreted protein